MEKGGDSRPLFYCGRGRLTVSCRPSSSRPWLSSPLCSIPPFMWVSRVASSVAAAWHAHTIATRALHLDIGHKEWLQQATLIPDVDYGCVIYDVKHKVLPKVKKISIAIEQRPTIFSGRVRRSRVALSPRGERCAMRRTPDRVTRDLQASATQRRSRGRRAGTCRTFPRYVA
jgi:hypothetical protein